MTGTAKCRIRRVVVPLDESPESQVALAEALALAERLRAELRGLFVEDMDLLHLADHPGAQVFSALTGARQSLDMATMERALRVAMERIRQRLEDEARRRRIKASLDVRRGRLPAEVAAMAEDGDLVIVDCSGPRPGHRRLPRGAARGLAGAPDRSVLLWQPARGLHGSVLTVFDGSPAALQALDAAAALADRDGGEIGILLIVDHPDAMGQLKTEAARHLGRLVPHWMYLSGGGIADIARIARDNQAGLLVMTAQAAGLADDGAEAALDDAGCSILLVG